MDECFFFCLFLAESRMLQRWKTSHLAASLVVCSQMFVLTVLWSHQARNRSDMNYSRRSVAIFRRRCFCGFSSVYLFPPAAFCWWRSATEAFWGNWTERGRGDDLRRTGVSRLKLGGPPLEGPSAGRRWRRSQSTEPSRNFSELLEKEGEREGTCREVWSSVPFYFSAFFYPSVCVRRCFSVAKIERVVYGMHQCTRIGHQVQNVFYWESTLASITTCSLGISFLCLLYLLFFSVFL